MPPVSWVGGPAYGSSEGQEFWNPDSALPGAGLQTGTGL